MAIIATENLFVEDEEILGSLEDEFGPSLIVMLKNFAHNNRGGVLTLQPHLDVLRNRVFPFLARTTFAFAEIYAMTDRSGSRQVNYRVAAQRLLAVQRNLQDIGVPREKVVHRFAKAIGEDFFEFKFKQSEGRDPFFSDNAKIAELRSVTILLSPAPIGIPTRSFRRGVFSQLARFCRQHVQQRG